MNDIHLGKLLGQFLLVALGQAAGNDQGVTAGIMLALGQVEDGVDALLFGLFDKGAGVDDDHIGFPLICGDLVLLSGKHAEHYFGIHQILRAAEADHADFLLFNRFHVNLFWDVSM